MGELVPLLGTSGGLGLFAIVIAYLLGSNRADRKQLGEQVDDAERRADAAEAREAALRASLSKELESERAARHSAEDRAAELAREVKRFQDPLT